MVRDLANNQTKWGWGSGAEPDTDVHTHVRADLRRPGDACVAGEWTVADVTRYRGTYSAGQCGRAAT